MASAGYRVSFEAFVNGEPEDEGITGGEAALHLGEGLNQSLIADGGVLCRLGIASSRRFGFEFVNKVWPDRLGTGALFGYSFDPVAEHGAGVGVDGPFDDALVVIDEETRRNEDLREALFHLVELNRAADGVGGATTELALIVNRRAFCSEVDLGRQGAKEGGWRGVKEIALIGDIGNPAVAFDFSGPSRTGGWGSAAGR